MEFTNSDKKEQERIKENIDVPAEFNKIMTDFIKFPLTKSGNHLPCFFDILYKENPVLHL